MSSKQSDDLKPEPDEKPGAANRRRRAGWHHWLRRGRSWFQKVVGSQTKPSLATAPPPAVSPDRKLDNPQLETQVPQFTPARVLQSSAPLDVVGAEEYVRYGPGLQRSLTGPGNRIVTPEDVTLRLAISSAAGAHLFSAPAIRLRRTEHIPLQRTAWASYEPGLHTAILWVWDFFRMTSFIQLRVGHPDDTDHAPSENARLLDVIEKLQRGDQLLLHVDGISRPIVQPHIVTHLPDKPATLQG
ncbi:MAG: hypothetical protein GYB66_15980 [Chloroflexi bacterium]|nr:hypothetical protein [Chloroflexota bacterium]